MQIKVLDFPGAFELSSESSQVKFWRDKWKHPLVPLIVELLGQQEHSDLLERLDKPGETKQEIDLQYRQQLLVSRYQVALAKRHAAKSISDAYRDILDILKKVIFANYWFSREMIKFFVRPRKVD